MFVKMMDERKQQKMVVFALLLLTLAPSQSAGEEDESLNAVSLASNGLHVIPYYNVHDQCLPQPGLMELHHNTLAFFLADHHYCGGLGLVLCYPGQLGENMPLSHASIQYKAENVEGNEVAEQCEAMRRAMAEKCGVDEKCRKLTGELPREEGEDGEQFGQGTWHGIQMRTNDLGNMTINLSTSNRTFVFPRQESGWFFLKLASAKEHGRSFLSRRFGPLRDFMAWGKHDHQGDDEERVNQIPVDEDRELLREFMRLISNGARIKNYMGIWSVGLDLLPEGEIDEIQLIANHSECCEMQAWYLRPMAQMPVAINEWPHIVDTPYKQDQVRLAEGIEVQVRGRVNEKAESFSFTVRNLLQIQDKISEMKMRVIMTPEPGHAIFEIMKNNELAFHAKRDHHNFVKGKDFLLKVKFYTNKLGVNLDCFDGIDVPFNDSRLAFEDLYSLEVDDDVKIYNTTDRPPLVKPNTIRSWVYTDGLKFATGLLFRGTINGSNSGSNFGIRLWHRNSTTGIYIMAVGLEVKLSNEHYFITYTDENGKIRTHKKEGIKFGKPLANNDRLDVFIGLVDGNKFFLWTNASFSKLFYNLIMEEMDQIHYAQVLDHFVPDLGFPIEAAYPYTAAAIFSFLVSHENGKLLKITAKVVPSKDGGEKRPDFTISVNSQLATEFHYVPLIIVGSCESVSDPLLLHFKLVEKKDASEVIVFPPVNASALPRIKVGDDFEVKIAFVARYSLKVWIDGVELGVMTPSKKVAYIDQYEIKGDIVVIKKPKDETKDG